MSSGSRRCRTLLLALALALCLPPVSLGTTFVYPNFNSTAGLVLNGDAATSSCDDGGPYAYDPPRRYAANDASETGAEGGAAAAAGTEWTLREGAADAAEATVVTAAPGEREDIAVHSAVLGHRDAAGAPPDPAGCAVRLRLTPSRAFKRASVFRSARVPVLDGFETGFSYQVTDHARACTLVKDASFGPLSHRSCRVHGGDGLALVLHGDPAAGAGALGAGGGGLGYGGLRNALVVELDAWYNPNARAPGGGGPPDADDALEDHVSVQAAPPGGDGAVTPGAATRLGHLARTPVADGAVHTLRVVYYPGVRADMLPRFSASTPLLPFLKDGGDGRPLGTLAVYADDGGGFEGGPPPPGGGPPFNASRPLLALPLNLAAALDAPEDAVWVGFTAATGSAWAKHDVLSWYFCDRPACPALRADAAALLRYYDSDAGAPPPNATAAEPPDAPSGTGGVDRYGPAAVV